MDYKIKVDLIIIAVCFGLPALYALYHWRKKKKEHIPNILEAEKKRKAHPDIQSGMFTRLYTMPYDEDLSGYTIGRYFAEHYPEVYYKCKDNYVWVSESKSGEGEERKIYIIQLRSDDVTAIELEDPHEIINEGRWGMGRSYVRTSLYDLGFSDKVRAALRAIQEESIAKKKR